MKLFNYLRLFVCVNPWLNTHLSNFWSSQQERKSTYFSPSANILFPMILFTLLLKFIQNKWLDFNKHKKKSVLNLPNTMTKQHKFKEIVRNLDGFKIHIYFYIFLKFKTLLCLWFYNIFFTKTRSRGRNKLTIGSFRHFSPQQKKYTHSTTLVKYSTLRAWVFIIKNHQKIHYIYSQHIIHPMYAISFRNYTVLWNVNLKTQLNTHTLTTY